MRRFLSLPSLRLLGLGIVLCSLTLVGLSLSPQKASADICSDNNGVLCYQGYFFNGYDGGPPATGTRWNVISAPAYIPTNNAFDMVNRTWGWLGGCPGGALWNQNDQNATGAAFIILTMLGYPQGTPKNVACQQFNTWANLVYTYENANLILFNHMQDYGGINTRSTLTDVAYYPMNGSAISIVFLDPVTRLPMYAIKKDCANPLGRLRALFRSYDLQPTITPLINGAPATADAEPGDRIDFNFGMNNNGPTHSDDVNCEARRLDHVGYFATPASPEGGGGLIGVGCPRSFPVGFTGMTTDTVNSAPANTTICRVLFVDPPGPGRPRLGTQVCVRVASKPYMKVYGGDVSVGAGFETAPDTCGTTANAGAVGWSRPGTFTGAGSQYAAMALGLVSGFATAQGGGNAPTPSGLSFANTSVNHSAGNFGGSFGSSTCIKDFWSRKPATTLPLASLSQGVGTYSATGDVTFAGGNVDPSTRWTIFIDGNLYITGDINFIGSWNASTVPSLQVIVRGNIYIRGATVNRLDGVYIAQPAGVNTGTIYTCANGFAPISFSAASYFNDCNRKLTVNGMFMAKNVEFLRTRGSLNGSSSGELSSSSNGGEVFNFSPVFWMVQPQVGSGRVDNYDAITSLPPVL